jgi:hypothetical protein
VDDNWVCGSCKSINRARSERCYSCHGVRDDALASSGSEKRTIEAVANRTVRDYLPSWPLAVLAGVLLVTVAVIGIVILVRSAEDFPALRDAFIAAIYRGGEGLEAGVLATQSAETAFLGLLRSGLVFLALVSFAAWLALATMNVPALGGGIPSRSPLRVFIYTLIPVWNLFKVPGMVQEVLYRLDARAGGAWMVMAATIGLLGSWFVSFIGSLVITGAFVGDFVAAATLEQRVGAFGSMMDQSYWLSVVTELMIATGTLLVVVLMVRVERRCAARNREVDATLDALAAGPAVPAAAGVPPVAPAPAAASPAAAVPTAMAPRGTEVPVPTPPAPTVPYYPGRRPGDLPAPAAPQVTPHVAEPSDAPGPPPPPPPA